MSVGRFICGVGAQIRARDGRYLLLRRSADKDYAPGVWESVTGRVEQGEGFEEALHREVCEEIGVAIEDALVIGTTHFYRGAPRPENELVGLVFLCTIADPDAICIEAEHAEARWLTAAQAMALLDAQDASTAWTRRVIERAEALSKLVPAEQVDFFRRNGFELG